MKFSRIKSVAPQWGASFTLHVAVIAALASFYVEIRQPPRLATVISDLNQPELVEEFQQDITTEQEIEFDSPVSLSPGLRGASAPAAQALANPVQSTMQQTALRTVSERNLIRPLSGGLGKLALGDNVSGLKGSNVIVGGDGDPGAMMQITMEILRQLDKSKVLVVWLLDSSKSLEDRREAIAKSLDRVYKELYELGVHENDAVLTAVAGVGEQSQFLLEKPSADVDAIREAIRSVADDETGKENLFTAAREVALKYRNYQTSGRRTLMIVLLTDEVGDDHATAVDAAVALLKRNGVPLYVMGPMASFSRPVIHELWRDPEYNYPFWLPMQRGPFTREEELLRVAFGDRPYPAGFGPFAMASIARETGGIFMIYGTERIYGKFDMDVLERYKANYGTEKEYLQEIGGSRLRKGLMEVVRRGNGIWNVDWPHPWLYAQSVGADLEDRQKIAATYLDFARKAVGMLESVESEWDKEPMPRWQANYDLSCARLLLAKVRADEFNWACADFKLTPRTLTDPKKNNGWNYKFRDDEFRAGTQPGADEPSKKEKEDTKYVDAARAMLEKARFHYQRVLDHHPDTPWALVAADEITGKARGEWVEDFDPYYVRPEDRRKANITPPKL